MNPPKTKAQLREEYKMFGVKLIKTLEDLIEGSSDAEIKWLQDLTPPEVFRITCETVVEKQKKLAQEKHNNNKKEIPLL